MWRSHLQLMLWLDLETHQLRKAAPCTILMIESISWCSLCTQMFVIRCTRGQQITWSGRGNVGTQSTLIRDAILDGGSSKLEEKSILKLGTNSESKTHIYLTQTLGIYCLLCPTPPCVDYGTMRYKNSISNNNCEFSLVIFVVISNTNCLVRYWVSHRLTQGIASGWLGATYAPNPMKGCHGSLPPLTWHQHTGCVQYRVLSVQWVPYW